MPVVLRRFGVALAALVLSSGLALAQSKVTLAVGGGSCLCYLPTMLAHALGEYEKAGVNVEIVDFKGGSESLKAVIGGSADVVSGYFDHCVNLAAKGQHLQAFVVYDRFPGFALVVSPKHASEINSIKDLANKKIGVSAMALDMGKGIASVLVARQIDPGAAGPAVAGMAAVLGHIYPVWLGFRGGKGVATTCGVFSILAPQATAIAGIFFILTVWWTKYISLGSVVASAVLGPLAYLTGSPEFTVIAAFVVAAIVIHRHRSNLGRVFAGIERRIGQRA